MENIVVINVFFFIKTTMGKGILGKITYYSIIEFDIYIFLKNNNKNNIYLIIMPFK